MHVRIVPLPESLGFVSFLDNQSIGELDEWRDDESGTTQDIGTHPFNENLLKGYHLIDAIRNDVHSVRDLADETLVVEDPGPLQRAPGFDPCPARPTRGGDTVCCCKVRPLTRQSVDEGSADVKLALVPLHSGLNEPESVVPQLIGNNEHNVGRTRGCRSGCGRLLEL